MNRSISFRRFAPLAIAAVIAFASTIFAPAAFAANFGSLVNYHGGSGLSNPSEGTTPVLSGDNCPDWNRGFPGVYVYSDINYQGRCSYFAPPLFWSYLPGSIGNDAASSMRIRQPSSGNWYHVWLYQHADQSGQYTVTDQPEVPDFRQYWFNQRTGNQPLNLNDQVSSFYISKQ